MKQCKFILVMMISVALVLLMASCKKSDSGNPAGPDNPAAASYGSGSISFNTNVTAVGNYNMSGTFNPVGYGSNGSGIMCWYDASSNTAVVYGYQWSSSTNWDWTVFTIHRPSGNALGTGTYDFAGQTSQVSLTFMKGASGMSSADGSYYSVTAGTANVTSYSATGMKGSFSGTGVGVSSGIYGSPIQVSNGNFDVTFGTVYGTP